jgi:hypothetical protein
MYICLHNNDCLNSATDNIFRLNTKNPEAVISILDESLEMNPGIRCDLISGISSSEFTLASLDRKQNKFLALEVFQNPDPSDPVKHAAWLKTIPGKSILLKNYNFKNISVELLNEQSTLVPSALFREEDASKYFHFNFNAGDSAIHSQPVRAFDAVNVFGVPELLNETMNHLFGNYDLHHHSTALLEGIHLSFKKSGEKLFFLNIRKDYIDIVVTEGKKLIFFNSFNTKSIDDLVYYVMFVCDRLQLNPETVSTYLLGAVERESAIYNLLYKYIRNIRFAPRPDVFSFSYVFKEIPSHFYFNLFSLALCES